MCDGQSPPHPNPTADHQSHCHLREPRSKPDPARPFATASLQSRASRLPIIGEVKAKDDTNLFVALVQGLTYAVELTTPRSGAD